MKEILKVEIFSKMTIANKLYKKIIRGDTTNG